MKLIKPKQISGEIMTLLDETDEKVIIVSPYTQTKNWKKIQNTFKNLKKRNIPIEFYYRKNIEEAKKEINFLGIDGIPVENLHCKIYMNEKYAVVSSMNLYEYSDVNSLDIAYKTETKKEYKEIYKFYTRYIQPHSIEVLNIDDLCEELDEDLIDSLDKNINIKNEENEIIINYGSSNYFFEINDLRELESIGILSRSQYAFAKENLSLLKNKFLRFELIEGVDNEYDTIHSTIKMKSSSLNNLFDTDYEDVMNSIYSMLSTVDNIKKQEYNSRRKK